MVFGRKFHWFAIAVFALWSICEGGLPRRLVEDAPAVNVSAPVGIRAEDVLPGGNPDEIAGGKPIGRRLVEDVPVGEISAPLGGIPEGFPELVISIEQLEEKPPGKPHPHGKPHGKPEGTPHGKPCANPDGDEAGGLAGAPAVSFGGGSGWKTVDAASRKNPHGKPPGKPCGKPHGSSAGSSSEEHHGKPHPHGKPHGKPEGTPNGKPEEVPETENLGRKLNH